MKMYKKPVWRILVLILTSKAALICLALLLRCIPTAEKFRFQPFYAVKALVNEDTLLRTHCCPWCFLGCANWETFVEDTKCFWTKSETFFVSQTQNLCPQQMLRVRANRETFVSATMCPRLTGLYTNNKLVYGLLTLLAALIDLCSDSMCQS